jgi:hypothetical protein
MHQSENIPRQNRIECKILKLSSGETLIAAVVNAEDDYIEVEMPFRLVTTVNNRGNLNLSILKWDVTIDMTRTIIIYKNSIVAHGEPTENMRSSYFDLLNNGFGSNEEEVDDEEEKENLDASITEEASKVIELLKAYRSNKLH